MTYPTTFPSSFSMILCVPSAIAAMAIKPACRCIQSGEESRAGMYINATGNSAFPPSVQLESVSREHDQSFLYKTNQRRTLDDPKPPRRRADNHSHRHLPQATCIVDIEVLAANAHAQHTSSISLHLIVASPPSSRTSDIPSRQHRTTPFTHP